VIQIRFHVVRLDDGGLSYPARLTVVRGQLTSGSDRAQLTCRPLVDARIR
jgi:hypothetical protein